MLLRMVRNFKDIIMNIFIKDHFRNIPSLPIVSCCLYRILLVLISWRYPTPVLRE